MENSYLSGLMGHPQPRHGPADSLDPAAHLRSGLSSSPWALSAQMSAAAAAGIPGYDLHRSLQVAAPSAPHNPFLPPPPPSGTPAPLHPHEDPATASLIAQASYSQRHSYLAAAAAAESQKRIAAEMHHHALSQAALREAAARRDEHLPPAPTLPRENLFSHGFPPLDRGGLYPSHGGILDPLSQSLPPPSHHSPLQPAFLSSHHARAVGSTHLSPTPSISTPSSSSSKDRNSTLHDEAKHFLTYERSKQPDKSPFESSSDNYRNVSTHPYGSRDGTLSSHKPLRTNISEDINTRQTSTKFTAPSTSTVTTVSSKNLSTVSSKNVNHEEMSSLTTSSSLAVSSITRLQNFTQTTSSHVVNSSSLVKTSSSSNSDVTKWTPSENRRTTTQDTLKNEENITPHHPLQRSLPNQTNSTKESNKSEHDDEVEEILVDDFDGQCSRTYPDNHSKIVRWRATRNEEERLLHGKNGNLEGNTNSSDVNSLSKSKEIDSNIRCKDWTKTDNSRKPLENSSSTNGSDTKKLCNQPSILSDHERDFAAKKRRLMQSSSLEHSKQTTTLTTESNSTGSIIPVGIAIGRQRQQQEPRPPAIGEKRNIDGQGLSTMPPHISPSGAIGASSLDPIAGGSSSSLKSIDSRMISSPHSAQSAHHAAQVAAHAAAQRWPVPYPSIGSTPSYPPISPNHWGLPRAPGSGQNYKPYGPIPMGYQLATDPLTGQILLIPTDSGVSHGSSLWPSPMPGTSAAPHHPGLSPYPPNPLLSPHHHAAAAAHAHAASIQQQQQHSIYLQHQQYQQQLQQQHQRRSGAPQPQLLSHGPTKASNRGQSGEPETITLSDDDDVQNNQGLPLGEVGNKSHVNSKEDEKKEQNSDLKGKDRKINAEFREPVESCSKKELMSSNTVKTENKEIGKLLNASPCGSENVGKSDVMPSNVSNGCIAPSKIKTERLSYNNVSLNGSSISNTTSNENIISGNESFNEPKYEITDNCEYLPSYMSQTNVALNDQIEIKREVDSTQGLPLSYDSLKLKEEATNESVSIGIPTHANMVCAMTLLQFAESEFESSSDSFDCNLNYPLALNSDGLDILLAAIEIRTFEKIELLNNSDIGVDMLCYITRQDCYRMGLGDSCYQMGLDGLCNVTKEDYLYFLYWINPMTLLKQHFRIREYRSEARAMMCRNFIADRIADRKDEPLLTLDENFQCPSPKIKSLHQVIRKIKNTEIMSKLEVSLREQIFDLQNVYTDKQKEVSRLKLTPMKVKKLKTKRQRGPGRPKKRILKSAKSKMGRPRKTRGSCESNDVENEGRDENLSDVVMDDDIDIVKLSDEHHLLPPILEPFKNSSAKLKNSRKSTESPPPPPLTPMMDTFGINARNNATNNSTNSHLISNLLRPPRLTANSTSTQQESNKLTFIKSRSSVTNLSTINEKFMKGRTNPFANLLTKLATKPTSAQNENDKKDEEASSQSDVDEYGKDKVSQTDGDESDKHDQEMESTSTEEEEDVSKHRQKNKPLITNIKSQQEGQIHSLRDQSIDNNSKEFGNEQNVSCKVSNKRINGKQVFVAQEQQDATTEQSSEQNVSSDFEDGYNNAAQKKRKSDKPKKHFGGTNEVETIVPKKPKNLFMMNCLKMQQNQRNEIKPSSNDNKSLIKKDEYDFTDEEDDEHEIIKIGKHRKLDTAPGTNSCNTAPSSPPSLPITCNASSPSKSTTVSRVNSSTNPPTHHQNRQQTSLNSSPLKERTLLSKSPQRPKSAASNSSFSSLKNQNPSSDESSTAGSPMKAPKGQAFNKKGSREKKKAVMDSGANKSIAVKSTHVCPESSRTSTLQENDLKDGLKMLTLQEGRFWPARLNSTPLPDIFGVVVEGQRGNRPNIMARDDILNQAILDLKPHCRKQLPVGTRVCVFWSNATGNCLFPGTIDTLEGLWPETSGMLQVILDDGDERQVEMSKVRLLPPNYQHVEYDPDPISSLRRRRVSADSADSGSGDHHMKRKDNMAPLSTISETTTKTSITTSTCSSSSQISNSKRNEQHGESNSINVNEAKDVSGKKHKKRRKHHHCKHKHKKLNVKQKLNSNQTPGEDAEDEESGEDDSEDENDQNLRIKLDGSFNNTTTYSIRSPVYPSGTRACSEGKSNHEEEKERDGDDELDGDSDENEEEGDDEDASDASDEETTPQKSPRKLSKLKLDSARKKGINPVTGRPLWRWVDGDDGYRRPGSKGKAKKLFHRDIQRGGNSDEILSVGDCAVFLSTARVDRPYIGKVELLWETWNGNMMVKVKWFYHPEEIETTGKKFDLKHQGGLFQSPHTDENDVQTISHKCSVLTMKEYSRMMTNDSVKRRKMQSSSDTYYLAGSYDPTSCAVSFQTGVTKQ